MIREGLLPILMLGSNEQAVSEILSQGRSEACGAPSAVTSAAGLFEETPRFCCGLAPAEQQ